MSYYFKFIIATDQKQYTNVYSKVKEKPRPEGIAWICSQIYYTQISQEELNEAMETINVQLQMLQDISSTSDHASASKIIQLQNQKCKELIQLLIKKKYITK